MTATKELNILFWGREGNYGPDYPRNRVVIHALRALGHQVEHFKPSLSALADWEATVLRWPVPDLIWVPCFRQRDVRAASRYARRHGLPLVIDPLISAYDKQVNERQKFGPDSRQARRLLTWERELFTLADGVVADTQGHADYYHDVLGVPPERLVVIPVSAEEELFPATRLLPKAPDEPLELVFFGTFIGLQGVEHLVEAIGRYDGPAVRWRLLGEGPLRADCEAKVAEFRQQRPDLDVAFENWRPLAELPARLQQADAFLGIFGASAKALRVIPNKVYQGLALGRPVITAATAAFPAALRGDEQQGVFWAEAGNAASIAAAVSRLQAQRSRLSAHSEAARATYDRYFSQQVVQASLARIIAKVLRQAPATTRS